MKPLPCTVRGAPPSAGPRTGHTHDTAADATYVYATPNDEYCCPFTLTSTLRADTPDCTGVAHSTSLESMYRAATDTPLPRPKRHASVVVSLK